MMNTAIKKKICIVFILVLLINFVVPGVSADEANAKFVKGVLIIETAYSLSDTELQDVLSALPAHRAEFVLCENGKNVYYISLENDDDYGEAHEILSGASGVLDFQPDYIYTENAVCRCVVESEYRWDDPMMEMVKDKLPDYEIIEKYELERTNIYYIRTLIDNQADELYEALTEFTGLIYVKASSYEGDSIAVPHQILRGDIDNDGEITVTDYLLMKSFILNTRDFSSDERDIADIDHNNSIDTTDLLMMKYHILGIKLIIMEDFTEEPDPIPLICLLFGHKDKAETVSVIKHNVRPEQPKCLETVSEVHTCKRCGNIRSKVISKQYIYCEE
ncbi:MAG: dockerin type I repeat-containing protein [Clostridia bacterium]|nr:dockerin type I repeat-containing protein [Clostridia bacterium]